MAVSFERSGAVMWFPLLYICTRSSHSMFPVSRKEVESYMVYLHSQHGGRWHLELSLYDQTSQTLGPSAILYQQATRRD